MHYIQVKSRNILCVGYDRPSLTMHLTFHKEGTPTRSYEYKNVLPESVVELIFAESIGGHFNSRIRNKEQFPCTPLAEIVGVVVKAVEA